MRHSWENKASSTAQLRAIVPPPHANKLWLGGPIHSVKPMIRTGGKRHRGKPGYQGHNAPNQKLPTTPTILRQLKGLWQQREQELDYIMMWAACCVCFFIGFLQLGEITVLNRSDYDPNSHLSFCDLAVND